MLKVVVRPVISPCRVPPEASEPDGEAEHGCHEQGNSRNARVEFEKANDSYYSDDSSHTKVRGVVTALVERVLRTQHTKHRPE